MSDIERRAGLRTVPDNPLTMDFIHGQYENQWVLVRVSVMDESRTPLEGTVIAHGRRGRVHQRLGRIVEAVAQTGEKPDMPYYIFHTSLKPINSIEPRGSQRL